ncbi:hypothetical protein GJAV_G00274330, partial [Gymnothorax javanicus]
VLPVGALQDVGLQVHVPRPWASADRCWPVQDCPEGLGHEQLVLHGRGVPGMLLMSQEVRGVNTGHLGAAGPGAQGAVSSCSHLQVVLRQDGGGAVKVAHFGQQCVSPPHLSGGAAHQRLDDAVDELPFRPAQASGTGRGTAAGGVHSAHVPGTQRALAAVCLREGRALSPHGDKSQGHVHLRSHLEDGLH